MKENGLAVMTGIYVRVSTEEQAKEGYSIRAQEEKLRSYAEIKGWHVYSVYADEGISGKDIDGRPAVKQLIADVISGKVNNVLVYKIDRLTRSTKNLIELVDIFNQQHCDFNSLVESIDTGSATGRMFLKIVGIFAEFERENLAERVRLGFERKAREGYALSVIVAPYGYNREKGSKIQEVEVEEAEIVRRIFDMYLRGNYNFTQIANVLNAENVATKKGGTWAVNTIRRIIKNPVYCGKVRYAVEDPSRYFEADGKHEAIIDGDTFGETQDKVKKTAKISPTKHPSSSVYFCGILYCRQCGARYSSHWNYDKRPKNLENDRRPAVHPNYRCSGVWKKQCGAKDMSHAKLERAFEEYIEQIADFDVDCDIDAPTVAPHDNSAEIAVITAEVALIERKTEEIMGLFMSSGLDFESYQKMVKVGSERRRELSARLEILENTQAAQENGQTRTQIVANLRENWSSLDNEQRQAFLQKFVKKIVVHNEAVIGKVQGEVVIDEVIFNEF